MKIFTVSEAAWILGGSADTVRRLERTGALPVAKTAGGMRLFNRVDIERLRARREEQQRQTARISGKQKGG